MITQAMIDEAYQYAYEQQEAYEQRVGDFYMADPAEQQASNEEFEAAYLYKLNQLLAEAKSTKSE